MASVIKAGNATDGVQVTSDNTGILELKTGTGAGTTAMTVSTGQNVTFAQTANLPNTFGFKNRINNGAMVIDQRNAGASVSPVASQFTLDRWNAFMNAVGAKYSVQQNAGSVTPPAGFSNYLGATSLSAYTVAAGEIMAFIQTIEGFNISDLAWGTANAQAVTLSFWVRSSLTGTFGGAVRQGSGARSYPFSYTISSSNTWEQKTITIPGDTSGTYATNNTAGIILSFGMGVGSTFSGTAGSWSGSNLVSATGATSVVGTNGATFYITGVQLEEGSTATSFDVRPYGTELQLCQRYYQKSFPIAIAPAQNTGVSSDSGQCLGGGYGTYCMRRFAVYMRANPTITGFNPSSANSLVRNTAIGADIQAVGVFVAAEGGFFYYPYGTNHDANGGQGFAWNWTASAEL